MIELRPFDRLGRFDNDWLSARHHFSFGSYYDPARSGLGPLLVWNDDTIRPDSGFDLHGHRDMEIITYVREGAISHRDHLGNEGRTEAGDVQVMSAGRGILHAELNRERAPTLIFQIWILPQVTGVPPRWEQRRFPKESRSGELVPLASGREGHADALRIYQDAAVLGATLGAGDSVTHELGGRQGYLVAATGRLTLTTAGEAPVEMGARDGAVVAGTSRLTITAEETSELLFADLPLS